MQVDPLGAVPEKCRQSTILSTWIHDRIYVSYTQRLRGLCLIVRLCTYAPERRQHELCKRKVQIASRETMPGEAREEVERRWMNTACSNIVLTALVQSRSNAFIFYDSKDELHGIAAAASLCVCNTGLTDLPRSSLRYSTSTVVEGAKFSQRPKIKPPLVNKIDRRIVRSRRMYCNHCCYYVVDSHI